MELKEAGQTMDETMDDEKKLRAKLEKIVARFEARMEATPSNHSNAANQSSFNTARSLGGSEPTTLASRVRLSFKSTLILSAPSITWWFVRM